MSNLVDSVFNNIKQLTNNLLIGLSVFVCDNNGVQSFLRSAFGRDRAIVSLTSQTAAYLLCPVLGWLADVWFKHRYFNA